MVLKLRYLLNAFSAQILYMGQQLTQTMASLETRDDTEDKPQIYAKNSMDRFGDDMCALILSYLSLEDRFRYEYVSKQFQRTVFESVVEFIINERLIRQMQNTNKTMSEMMETIAIKCPNIAIIDCRGIQLLDETLAKVLTIFHENCVHLRHIYCNLHPKCCYQHISYFGPLITRLACVAPKHSLIHYHRLSHLTVDSIRQVFDKYWGEVMVKNLLAFEFTFDDKYVRNHMLSAFVVHNQSLTCLVITINSQNTITELIQQLSYLPRLRQLTLKFIEYPKQYSLSDSLRTIGVNCKQLKRLSLVLGSKTAKVDKQIMKLLNIWRKHKLLNTTPSYEGISVNHHSFDPSLPGQRLTHLSIICWEMEFKLCDKLYKLWPRLQHLSIQCLYFKGRRLDRISRLTALKTLVINAIIIDDIEDNVFTDLLSSSPKLKTIEIRVNNEKKFYSKEK